MNFTPLSKIPDVSFYQDDNATPQKIDFARMKTQCEGVVIRAGQRNWIDEDFIHNWQAAKAAGLMRASYWFYDSRETPERQADLWQAAIGNDLPEWGLWSDLEESYGGAYRGEANWKKFCEGVKARFPNAPQGIYTANWWWAQQSVSQADYWASYPLWVAQYVSNPADVVLPLPWKTKGAVLWQFTSKGDGLLYGAESLEIDLNYTSQAFYNLFGAVVPPPPLPEGKDMIFINLVTTAGLNGRALPDASSAIVWQGGMKLNDLVIADEKSGAWFKVRAVIRAGASVTLPAAPAIWASMGGTGTLQKQLASFDTPVPLDLEALIISANVPVTLQIKSDTQTVNFAGTASANLTKQP